MDGNRTSTTSEQWRAAHGHRAAYVGLLLAIVLLGTLIRLVHFQPSMGDDDQRWILTARALVHGTEVRVPQPYYQRIGWRLFLAAGCSLLGDITLDRSAYLMFFLSACSTVLVATLARECYGTGPALLAALLHATAPVNVLHDVLTLPDSLAVPVLLLSALGFARFLRQDRASSLMQAGACAGLLIIIKSYYALIFLIYGAALLGRGGPRSTCRQIAALVGFGLLGFALFFALRWWETGESVACLQWFRIMSAYSKHLVGSGLDLDYILRFNYFHWMFDPLGSTSVMGTLYLAGVLFLGCAAWYDERARLLLAAALLFVVFLSAMPMRLQPLRFVEQQPRYLMIVEPFLAIGAGAALWHLLCSCWHLGERAAVLTVLVLLCLLNAASVHHVAAQMFRRTYAEGVNSCINLLKQQNVTQLVLPSYHEQILPDALRRRAITIGFAPPFQYDYDAHKGSTDLGNFNAYLGRSDTALFFPVSSAWGEPYQRIEATLTAAGYQCCRIDVADSTLGRGLAHLGLTSEGRLLSGLERLGLPTLTNRKPAGFLWIPGTRSSDR